MKCQLKSCGIEIPKSRKRSAIYCSDECYYEVKKVRSCQRYASLSAPAKEIKRCEGILAYLYGIAQLKKAITADDLQTLNFDFSLADNEYLDDKKRLFKIIGSFGYYIEPNKNLIIWKFRQKP